MGEEMGDMLHYMNATTGGLFVPVMAVAFAVLVMVSSVAALVWYFKPSKEAEAQMSQGDSQREAPIIWNQLG